MDDAIGDVIDLYKKYGYWKNTIVVFSSDNGGKNVGGGYNFPLRGEKGGLYEGMFSSPDARGTRVRMESAEL